MILVNVVILVILVILVNLENLENLVNLVNLMFLSSEYIFEMIQLQGYKDQNRVLLLLKNVTV